MKQLIIILVWLGFILHEQVVQANIFSARGRGFHMDDEMIKKDG